MLNKIPLNTLKFFEATARLGSIQAAATELAVTPAAVSAQIKKLETWLGTALFTRTQNKLSLSADGQSLYPALHDLFLNLQAVLLTLKPEPSLATITLSTTHAFASGWLIPKLNLFYQRHPNHHVTLHTTNDVIDLSRSTAIDLVIRCHHNDDSGLHQQHLFDEYFCAYASPSYAHPEQVEHVQLIHTQWAAPSALVKSWTDWCVASEQQNWEGTINRFFDDEHYALQAASLGQGLVLASNVLAEDYIRRGLLLPYRPEIRLPGGRYSALCLHASLRRPATKNFFTWLSTLT